MRSVFIAILLLAGNLLHAETSLLGTIQFSSDSEAKYQIGTPLSFGCKVKNLGLNKSSPGKLWIQFQYPKDLKDKPNSLLFKTEVQDIPSIAPGDQLLVQFKTTQTLPNLFDFIKNDWAMREYQAVLEVDGKEYVIGSANLTFSAYYYEAPQRQAPTAVP